MGSAEHPLPPQPVKSLSGNSNAIKSEVTSSATGGGLGFGGLSFGYGPEAPAAAPAGSNTSGFSSHAGLGSTNGTTGHGSSSYAPSFVHGHGPGGAPANFDEEEEQVVLPNAFGRQ